MHREARAHSMKKYYRLLLCSLIPLVAAALLANLFIVFTLRRRAFEQFHEVAKFIWIPSIFRSPPSSGKSAGPPCAMRAFRPSRIPIASPS